MTDQAIIKKETRLLTRNGNTAETRLERCGRLFDITTTKGLKSVYSSIQEVKDEGNGLTSYTFGDPHAFSYRQVHIDIKRATKKAILTKHNEFLALAEEKINSLELDDVYTIEIGQIVYSKNPQCNERRRVVYEINGNSYKTALLDGSGTRIDSHLRPSDKVFGIGTYYHKGDIYKGNLENLILDCIAADKEIEKKRQEEAKAERERREYFEQFKQLTVKETTNAIKKHLKTKFGVKSSVRYESFSGGDSLKVIYYAPEKIQEIEDFINSLKYGRFNGMIDMYEYSDSDPVILDGCRLQTYKFTRCEWEKGEYINDPARETSPEPFVMDELDFEVQKYSEKSFAIFGDTKPMKEILKSLGCKFNPKLKYNGNDDDRRCGWIFSAKNQDKVFQALKINQ